MRFLCKKCGITFADRQSKRLHYTDSWREISYDTDLNEQRSGHYLKCMRDGALIQYFETDGERVYRHKKDAALHMKADRAFITRQELEEIVSPFDLNVDEIVKTCQISVFVGIDTARKVSRKQRLLRLPEKYFLKAE